MGVGDDYFSNEKLAVVLSKICDLVPDHRIKVPLLSWDYYRSVDATVKLLKARGYYAERYEGGYYDSYAEGDSDLCIICGLRADAPVLFGTVNYTVRNGENKITLVSDCPWFDYEQFASRKFENYTRATQYEMFDIMYGKGNYRWMVRDEERTPHANGKGYTVRDTSYEVPRE